MPEEPFAFEPDPESLELLGFLSHEMKSPLASIESILKVIADGFAGEVDPKARLFIDRAIAKTGETRVLVSEILNFQKYQAGIIEKSEIDVLAVVHSLYRAAQSGASEKNIIMDFNCPPGLRIFMLGEQAGISHAIGNILDNAVKYSPEHGQVRMLLHMDTAGKEMSLSIEDTGQGIAEQDRERLFKPFFRSALQRGKVPGVGLGLSIARKIIGLHKGRISLDSAPGKGARFTIVLPYERVEESTAHPKRRIVIVGGVTAGPKTAARIRRLDEDAEITIVEQSEFLSYAGCGIPAYLSGKVISPKALMSTADNTLRDVHFFEFIKNIKIMNRTRATKIDREKKEVLVEDLVSHSKFALAYDVLVIATGARSAIPDIPGIKSEKVHSLYNIEDAQRIKRFFSEHRASDVYIIGGGLVGIETAESLINTGARVTVLEKDSSILKIFDADISKKIMEVLSRKGVKTITDVCVREIREINGRGMIVTDQGDFTADLIILSAGVIPNSELGHSAGLAIGGSGGIVVDRHLVTSDPSIYAVGDCAESANLICPDCRYLPLGSVSTKMGRIAADNIAGRPVEFTGSIGTAMFKVFDISVARTGLGEEDARMRGMDYETVVATGQDRTHYFEGADYIVLKLLADRKTKRLLGASGYGRGDLVPRIEVLAAAIQHGFSLHEIFLLDLGYFPAFNNPIDILQTTANVLENKIEGLLRTIKLESLLENPGKYPVVDVSPAALHSFGSIPGSINMPLENLRAMTPPFAKDKEIVLYSRTSSRAYEAARYLSSRGFKECMVLEGGYVFYGGS